MDKELIEKKEKLDRLIKTDKETSIMFFIITVVGCCATIPAALIAWFNLFHVSYSMTYEKVSNILFYIGAALSFFGLVDIIMFAPLREKRITALSDEIFKIKCGMSREEYLQEQFKEYGQTESGRKADN